MPATILVTIAAGLIGVMIGGLLSSTSHHRQWLREARREAYARLLIGYDKAVEAANVYVDAIGVAMENSSGNDMVQETKHLHEIWNEFNCRYGEWLERKGAVEVLRDSPSR